MCDFAYIPVDRVTDSLAHDRTKLIDDAKGPNPQYRGLLHGTVSIVKQEGIFGIYRGLFPVVRAERMSTSRPRASRLITCLR